MSKRRLKEEIYSTKKELNFLSRYIVPGVWMKIQDLESRLDSCMEREERYWRQRSKIEWLQSGDKNTIFFSYEVIRQEGTEHERLSCLINQGLRNGSITGLKCSRFGPVISHLFFVDDSLLFTRASTSDCAAIKEILSIYVRASGQLVNFDKSSMCVSPYVVRQESERLAGRHLHDNQAPTIVTWKPLLSVFYKINTNTAIDGVGQMIGIRIVIRDDIGFVMASSSQRIIATFTSQRAEAMAILKGLMVCA
ncbi:hypothetical protein Ddye_012577 [Dipteronia dyeriana]|uniref:RNase H type-1 domain-containing protein n=1 Tax=Dipteronia dyeriana TaxID=168575 RepID=A0AAE0CIT1_9ROSI|nr:hypothetical protein Ddye_012577 [Dipteronia dyeriana]